MSEPPPEQLRAIRDLTGTLDRIADDMRLMHGPPS
jgi:hypothetical protein